MSKKKNKEKNVPAQSQSNDDKSVLAPLDAVFVVGNYSMTRKIALSLIVDESVGDRVKKAANDTLQKIRVDPGVLWLAAAVVTFTLIVTLFVIN